MPQPEAIKKAIKEALDDKKLDDLAAQLTGLTTQMAAGFSAVHTRQDVANGKLMAHQARFEQMDGEAKGKGNYTWLNNLLITTLTSAAVGLVVYLVTHHG